MRTWIPALLAIAMTACPQLLCSQTASDSAPAKSAASTLTTAAASGKSGAESPSHLVLTKTVALDVAPTSSIGIPKCDGDGNFYVGSADRAGTISKFNSKGKAIATFNPSSSPEATQLDLAGKFTVDADGNVYQLVFPHSYDRDVFLYNKNGTYKSKVILNATRGWHPSLFVALRSGNFMATGQKWDRIAKDYVPFTGIFSSDGTLLKELHLEDDENIQQLAAWGDSRFVPGPVSGGLNFAIDRGEMQLGADGNVYLLRWLNPAVIYAISPGGKIERRFTVDPGDPDFTVGGMATAGNRIAVVFRRGREHDNVEQQVIQVVDLEGGKVATYPQPMEDGHVAFGITLACYTHDPEQFIFLGWAKDEKPVLNITGPR